MSGNLIPDEMAQRTGRLINEAEDMRAQAADDLKTIYADLREELKSLGWRGAEVSEQVAAFKAAISEMRLDDEKKAKREAKGDLVSEYINVLTVSRARARARAKESVQSHGALGPSAPAESAPAESASGEISATNQESAGVKLAALASSDPHEADESGSLIHEPDATTSRPEPAVNPAGHIDTPATGQASAQSGGGAIGGVMDAKCRLPDAAGVEPSPSVTFTNPKCLNPQTCLGAHSKTACFDCVMEYGKRPTEEQRRLWAEATGVAVV